jgi:putative transposase
MRLGSRKSRSSTYCGSRRPGHAPRNVRRWHGFSAGTLYKWQWKFGGPEVSGAKPLRSLEEENGKLKKLLLAESMLDSAALKDLPAEEQVKLAKVVLNLALRTRICF